MITKHQICLRLQKLRYETGLTMPEAVKQARLVDPEIRLDPSQLSRMERGKIEISLSVLLALLCVYNTGVQEFFETGTGDEALVYITENETLSALLGALVDTIDSECAIGFLKSELDIRLRILDCQRILIHE